MESTVSTSRSKIQNIYRLIVVYSQEIEIEGFRPLFCTGFIMTFASCLVVKVLKYKMFIPMLQAFGANCLIWNWQNAISFTLWFIPFPMATIDTQFLKAEGRQVIRHPTITVIRYDRTPHNKLGNSSLLNSLQRVLRLFGHFNRVYCFPRRERKPTFIYSWNFIVSCVYCCICISGWKARWKTAILWHWIFKADELVLII